MMINAIKIRASLTKVTIIVYTIELRKKNHVEIISYNVFKLDLEFHNYVGIFFFLVDETPSYVRGPLTRKVIN